MSVQISIRAEEQWMKNLDDYCARMGVSRTEFIRITVAEKFTALSACMSSARQSSGARELTKGSISKDIEGAQGAKSKKKGDEIQSYFKAFIAGISVNKKFPARIHKAIKEQWVALKEWGKGPQALAQQYNKYVQDEELKDSYPSMPNSWISGHGFLNEDSKEEEKHYDF